MSADYLALRKTKRRGFRQNHSHSKQVDNTMSLLEMFERFMAYKRADGLTKVTLDDYYIHIRCFLEFIEADDLSNEQINLTTFKGYMAHMLNRSLAPTTVNVRIRTLRALFRFCCGVYTRAI